ncbi:MAG: hypothetical protein GAK35_01042 [Herbaspirillum frisingense]|uniref:Uncharacterized protein n=1 Tax=Herbaspirillum frisingense TaxID=92645 RepID=A0A7V8FYQ1_9BURK|nr:MAG: hypothetical protein GAK35_01042 [Herbaspirillum frisingense]
MNQPDPRLAAFAEILAARHRIPKATVAHPAGVIVPDDEFMTEKLRDPDYVPYCMMSGPCGRVRRTTFGFECPTCGNKTNFDLTHYNGNVDVQYEGGNAAEGAQDEPVEDHD